MSIPSTSTSSSVDIPTAIQDVRGGCKYINVSNQNLDDDNVKNLVLNLSGSQVTDLDLSYNKLTSTTIENLDTALKSKSFPLKRLDLSNTRINDSCASALAYLVIEHPSIEQIDVLSTRMTGVGKHMVDAARSFNSLVEDLKTKHRVCTLVGLDKIPEERKKTLAQRLNNVLRLSCINCGLTSRNIKLFSSYLKNNKLITTIDFSGNPIGDDGAYYVAKCVNCLPCLKRLFLANANIDDKGIEYLASHMKSNTVIKVLDLGNNLIRDKGLKKIADTLEENSTIKVLDISGNYEKMGCGTQEGLNYLFLKLKTNPKLEILRLREHVMSANISNNLTEMLVANSCLKTLDIKSKATKTWPPYSVLKAIEAALKTNQSLLVLKCLPPLNIIENQIYSSIIQVLQSRQLNLHLIPTSKKIDDNQNSIKLDNRIIAYLKISKETGYWEYMHEHAIQEVSFSIGGSVIGAVGLGLAAYLIPSIGIGASTGGIAGFFIGGILGFAIYNFYGAYVDFPNWEKIRSTEKLYDCFIDYLDQVLTHHTKLLCPHSQGLMKLPVQAPDGIVYDMSSIEEMSKKGILVDLNHQKISFSDLGERPDIAIHLKTIEKIIKVLSLSVAAERENIYKAIKNSQLTDNEAIEAADYVFEKLSYLSEIYVRDYFEKFKKRITKNLNPFSKNFLK